MEIEFINSGSLLSTDKQKLVDAYFKIMVDIKEKYGVWDQTYDLIAFEFKNQVPQNYFRDDKKVIIILGDYALNDVNWLIWQMAHECIHWISPETQIAKLPPTYLEEGLATYYAKSYSRQNGGRTFDNPCNLITMQYDLASSWVENLLNMDYDIIKKVRFNQPSLSRITSVDLININPSLDRDLCAKLCKIFP